MVVETSLQELAISVANLNRKPTEFGKPVQNPQRLEASSRRLIEFRSCRILGVNLQLVVQYVCNIQGH
jgi:hypothetical protein